MGEAIKDELKALYGDASKHSAYQSTPDFVSEALGYSESIDQGWRGDRPRLDYLLAMRKPEDGEHWGDFGANTGFFTLSLAHRYPSARFTAIEANANHARFIARVADHFGLANVEVMDRSVGLRELRDLPRFDFLLHLNVLHHAGHDFDGDLVLGRDSFPNYVVDYLRSLRLRAHRMLFQVGSNWGGDKLQPLIGAQEDLAKLILFSGWLDTAGWRIEASAYPRKDGNGKIEYQRLRATSGEPVGQAIPTDKEALKRAVNAIDLNVFPGEFYRRPLFLCKGE
jgi:hypothetical protein